MNTPHWGVKVSGSISRASSAVWTRLRSSGARMRLRRCSTSAFASGLEKGRCGRVNSTVSLMRLLAGLVLHAQPDANLRAGPGMGRQIDERAGLGRIILMAGDRQRERGGRHEAAACEAAGALDQALDRGDAVIVPPLVGEGEAAFVVGLRRPRKGDFRRPVGDGLEGQAGRAGKARLDGDLGVAFEREALLAQIRPRALLRAGGARDRRLP